MVRMLLAAIICGAVSLIFAADPANPPEPIVLHVGMTATADGEMQALLFEGKPIAEPADKRRTRFDELQSIIRKEIETAPGSPDASRFEVVIEASRGMKLESVVKVMGAISSYRSETDGKTYPLVKNVRIRTAGAPPADNSLNLKLPDGLKVDLPKPK
jgi:hypothetical protein